MRMFNSLNGIMQLYGEIINLFCCIAYWKIFNPKQALSTIACLPWLHMAFFGCFLLSLRLFSPSASKLFIPLYSNESHWFEKRTFLQMYIADNKEDTSCPVFYFIGLLCSILPRFSGWLSVQQCWKIPCGCETPVKVLEIKKPRKCFYFLVSHIQC